MDHSTVERWHALAVPHPATEHVETDLLTDDELGALAVLRRDGLRLEQEGIPIDRAVDELLDG